MVRVVKKVVPQETAPAEELSYLPYGLQQPAGAGLEACLYCQHYSSHPGLTCRPLCVCRLHQGLIPNEQISSVKCPEWQASYSCRQDR